MRKYTPREKALMKARHISSDDLRKSIEWAGRHATLDQTREVRAMIVAERVKEVEKRFAHDAN